MPHQIDDIDRTIMNILIENARTSYADIAKEVGMKSPSVIDRIKKMEEMGIIKDYTTKLNYKKLGFDILAFIGIGIDNAQHIDEFEAHLVNLDNDIAECFHVTGDYTMIIKVITQNTATLSTLIKKIRNLPGVQRTNTMLVFNTMLNIQRPV